MVRTKSRLLLLELVWKDERIDTAVNEVTILNAIRQSLVANFGDHGLGLALGTMQIKYFNPVTNLCIVRSSREQYRQVWGAITLINTINHRTVLFRLHKGSGHQAAVQIMLRRSWTLPLSDAVQGVDLIIGWRR
ncbi:hypothetical protein WJX73_009101 [Symbiochloris irregularis]|uniref:Uncharacterized protein n=1 Tax=Symbiochloris irregularis TaxID=706552 RepID=A0AAW1NUB2_9CHLO